MLLLLGGHADDGEFLFVAIHIAREPLAKDAGVERVGLHALARLIELARGDDVTGRAERLEPPAQPEAKPARFIDHEDAVAFSQQRLHPRDELRGGKTPRRLGRGVPLLGRDDVAGRVDVETELDRRARKATVGSGGRECGRPSAMKNDVLHTKGELPSSLSAFHAIYALQRTAPRVTLAAAHHPAACAHPAPAALPQPARQPPPSLSLGSLGVPARLP